MMIMCLHCVHKFSSPSRSRCSEKKRAERKSLVIKLPRSHTPHIQLISNAQLNKTRFPSMIKLRRHSSTKQSLHVANLNDLNYP